MFIRKEVNESSLVDKHENVFCDEWVAWCYVRSASEYVNVDWSYLISSCMCSLFSNANG